MCVCIADPTGWYQQHPESFRHRAPLDLLTCLREACGLIPHFLQDDDDSIRANLETNYPFGVNGNPGAQVDEHGVHRYPGDPELYPYMRIDKGQEVAYIYPSALVSIHEADGEWFHTRID